MMRHSGFLWNICLCTSTHVGGVGFGKGGTNVGEVFRGEQSKRILMNDEIIQIHEYILKKLVAIEILV
jgi:hypothetical protein